jgi:hypothetical protein
LGVRNGNAASSKSHARKRVAVEAARERARGEATTSLDPVLLDFVRDYTLDLGFFVEKLLSVDPIEGGDIVPFVLNPGQRVVVGAIKEQSDAGEPMRVIVLKSRRQGISTLSEALVYGMASTRPNHHGLVIAHKNDAAADLHRMAKGFYETDQRHKIPGLIPEIEASNETALRFDNPDKKARATRPGLRSSMVVGSAEGRGVARGKTLHSVHASEVAFWSNSSVWQGVGNALTYAPDTLGIMESTANGIGNLFHKTWVQAIKGKNEWKPVFLPWSIDPRCQIEVSAREEREWDFGDAKERDLFEKHGLTLAQLKWRRRKMASPDVVTPGLSEEDMFRQEYPLTPDEAFLTTGKHFFLPEGLERLAASSKGVTKPVKRVNLEVPPGVNLVQRPAGEYAKVMPLIRDDQYGQVTVWEPPVEGGDYVLGGDVAEGLEHGDYSVAWVFRRDTLSFVARLKTARMDPDQFGQQCALLGWWFNEALVAVEYNGPGLAANLALRRAHYRRLWFDRDTGKIGEPTSGHYQGWRTTSANRPTMLWRLEEEIRSGTIAMPAEEFFDEARTFQIVDGRPEALVGAHDDEIMAAAIAVQIHVLGGAVRGRAVRKEKLRETKLTYWDPKPQFDERPKRQIRNAEAW